MNVKNSTAFSRNYLNGATLPLLAILVFISSISSTKVFGQTTTQPPNFKVQYGSGESQEGMEIDLEKGISLDVQKLAVKASETNDLEYMAHLLYTTHVSNGMGRGTMKTGQNIPMREFFTKGNAEKGDKLKVEMREYQTKDSEGRVQTIKLEQPLVFLIPVI